MALAGKLRNVLRRGVFQSTPSVSDDVMQVFSLPLADSFQDDTALVSQALKRHDPEVIDQLIVQYQHRLLRYLLYLTGDRELAEDLFQETWMRVLVRGDQFNGKSRFDTWLFTIARNLAIDTRRKRTMCSLDAMCETRNGEKASFEPASGEPSPLDQYESLESGCRVAEALLSLEPLHREVLVLRFQEEMSLEEIARVTGAPLSTVKSRLYRGLAALKPRVLGEQEAGQAVAARSSVGEVAPGRRARQVGMMGADA